MQVQGAQRLYLVYCHTLQRRSRQLGSTAAPGAGVRLKLTWIGPLMHAPHLHSTASLSSAVLLCSHALPWQTSQLCDIKIQMPLHFSDCIWVQRLLLWCLRSYTFLSFPSAGQADWKCNFSSKHLRHMAAAPVRNGLSSFCIKPIGNLQAESKHNDHMAPRAFSCLIVCC